MCLTFALGLALRGVTIDIADFSLGVFRISVGALRWASQRLLIASALLVGALNIICFHLYYT